ncbi:MAG: hypothetical protein WAM73_20765 [Desulfobacterales bacterium]
MFAAAGRYDRPISGKKTIYGWTLSNCERTFPDARLSMAVNCATILGCLFQLTTSIEK